MNLLEIRDPTEDDPALRTAYDLVLRPSFDHDELPSIDTIVAGHAAGGFNLVLLAVDHETPLGVAVYSEDESGIGCLDYLAARPGQRSRGVGAALMERLNSIWAERPVAAVVGEVHDPRYYAEAADERPAARVRFYERFGARVLNVPWVQPRLSTEGERVDRMLLLSFGPAASAGVPSDVLGAWVERYYATTEGAIPEDLTFRSLWARIHEHAVISALPIADHGVAPLEVS